MAKAFGRSLVVAILVVLLLPACTSSGRTVRAGDASSDAPTSQSVTDTPQAAAGPPAGATASVETAPIQRARNRGAVALESQAMGEYSSGDHERAAAMLERAIRLDPYDAGLWVALGEVRLAQGRPELAESLGMKAAALASGDPEQLSEARRLLAKARGAQ